MQFSLAYKYYFPGENVLLTLNMKYKKKKQILRLAVIVLDFSQKKDLNFYFLLHLVRVIKNKGECGTLSRLRSYSLPLTSTLVTAENRLIFLSPSFKNLLV